MVAIYARKSVERIESISIETQIEECLKKIGRKEKYQVYKDNGFSGKDTNRPAFQQMMQDFYEGKIEKVVVYKFDRISRSISDFVRLLDEFCENGVTFISCQEDVDTSGSMGKVITVILAAIAQLERETIQQRVFDAYYSRSRKGFFMGGKIPYGFRKEETYICGAKTSKFVADAEEAAVVRFIYESYAEPKASIGDIIKALAAQGILRNGKPWERARVADVLKSAAYVKADIDVYNFFHENNVEIVNEPAEFDGVHGCYYFSGNQKQAVGRKQSSLAGNVIVLAPHEGIVESDIWLKCRIKMLHNKQFKTQPKAKNTWLAGKVKCGRCGYALVDKNYKTKTVRYLLCSNRMNSKSCEGPGVVHTDEVEQAVFLAIKKRLKEFTSLKAEKKKKANPELASLNLRLVTLDKKIENLASRISEADDALFSYINAEVKKLSEEKKEVVARVEELTRLDTENTDELVHHVENWDKLSFDDRRRVVDAMIKVIKVTSEKVEIQWRF